MIAYTKGTPDPVYTLHAINLSNLGNTMPPQVISASHTLADGTTFTFNATYQRQRPALLMANGNIYAGFGSWCDFKPSLSRGWLLGWNASTLAPLATNRIMDTQATSPNSFFLSSIWMSGSGPAADDSGDILFVTGNSDPSGTIYDGVTNIQESVVKVTPDLLTMLDIFTPMNWPKLDEGDTEFGSGGVMVLPDQIGATPHLAVAAGKDGEMYFMNEDDLGGYSPTANNILGSYFIGKCWCGESYYVNAGGAHVVTSGGTIIKEFNVVTSPKPALTAFNAVVINNGQSVQYPSGFYTSVSSNGKNSAIIWAISRPLSNTQPDMTLYAVNPNTTTGKMDLLYSTVAGQWPYYTGRYNLPPTVANGKVYVASNKLLNIYGLLPTK
jgi:hypothetical protein